MIDSHALASMARALATALVFSMALVVTDTNAAEPMKLTFGGQDYVHRWSKDGQHEFTPPSEPDLQKWQHMVTVNVHDKVRNGDQLAQLANGIVGNYQKAGKILGTHSQPRTKTAEAEHLVVAILAARGVMEAVFARVKLVDGVGVVVVYSQREYGDKAADDIGAWLEKNGASVEKTLMTWDRFPRVAALNALPVSK